MPYANGLFRRSGVYAEKVMTRINMFRMLLGLELLLVPLMILCNNRKA
jgi:hypothetical protein